MGHALVQAIGGWIGKPGLGPRARQINYDLAICLLDLVLQRARRIDHYPGIFGSGPNSGVLQLGSLGGTHGYQRQHHGGSISGPLVQVAIHEPH
jgi:hypothetical protein